jgi:hypothetical protein
VRINGVDTALTAVISGTAGFAANSAALIPFNAGDAISVMLVNSASAVDNTPRVTVTLQF